MRIIRGLFKARRFTPPKKFPSRPTTDYAKEGIFNIIENRLSLIDLNILDLCAGTGNISIEFLSRESGTITSVDKHPLCTSYMEKTKKELEIGDEWLIVRNDVSQYLERCNDSFDLIFCDPPYDIKFHDDIIQRIQKKNILNEDGLIIMEHGKQTVLNHLEGYIETRNFGNVFFSFFQFS